jgi:Bacterial PH domain
VAGDGARVRSAPVRFGPDRRSLAVVGVWALGTLPLAGSSLWLLWLLLLPLAAAWWVLRAGVVADADGLEVGNGLRRGRHAWPDVTGFDVPRRGPVRLLLADGRRVPMTALPRRDLPRLLEVGGSTAP